MPHLSGERSLLLPCRHGGGGDARWPVGPGLRQMARQERLPDCLLRQLLSARLLSHRQLFKCYPEEGLGLGLGLGSGSGSGLGLGLGLG